MAARGARHAEDSEGLLRSLSRSALLMGWCLVGWGTLLDLAALLRALEEGVGPALRGLVDGEGAWAVLNALCAAGAPLVWIAVLAVWRFRTADPLPHPTSPDDPSR